MNIRFVSTLTAEDENRLAPGFVKALSALAEMFPIQFSLRLDTTDGRTYRAGSLGGPAGPTMATLRMKSTAES